MGNTRAVPIVEKHGVHDMFAMNGVSAISSMEGWRKNMEDAHILINMKDYIIMGVFDGHGNEICAHFCQNNFLRIFEVELSKICVQNPTPEDFKHVLTKTFLKLDEEFKPIAFSNNGSEKSKAYESGTTALVAIITDTHYIIANTGDSRGLVIDKTLKTVKFATIDHKPNDEVERSRITKAGHCVLMNRVDRELAVSRALGDFSFKDGDFLPEDFAVTCAPDVSIVSKEFNTLLILACDGIWDVMTNETVMEYLLRMKKHTFKTPIEFEMGKVCTIDKYYKMIAETSLDSTSDANPIENLCEHLIDIALDLESKDNFSVAIYNC